MHSLIESNQFLHAQSSVLLDRCQTLESSGKAQYTNQAANFSPNIANSRNVFRELVPNPMMKDGIKRSLEIHLEDIKSTCSLKGKP